MQASLDNCYSACRLLKLNRHKIALQATCFRWKSCEKTSEKNDDLEFFLKSERALDSPWYIFFCAQTVENLSRDSQQDRRGLCMCVCLVFV